LPESSKPKTASEKQIAANRANAQHSSGPRTAEGKARSAQNARKYGFYGNAYNVPMLEDLEDVANLREDFAAAYHPRNPAEMEAVEQIAIAHQARLRAIRLEVGLFTSMLDQVYSVARDNVPGICEELAAAATPKRSTIPEIRNFMLAEGFRRMKPELWSGFLRHRAQVERFYHQAVEDFDHLKTLRDEPDEDLRNEPNSAAQPEETEPLPPTQNEPENGPESEPEGPPPRPAAPECPPDPNPPAPTPENEPCRPPCPAPECPPERPPVPNPPPPTPEHQPVAPSPLLDSPTLSLPPAVRCSHRSALSGPSERQPAAPSPRPSRLPSSAMSPSSAVHRSHRSALSVSSERQPAAPSFTTTITGAKARPGIVARQRTGPGGRPLGRAGTPKVSRKNDFSAPGHPLPGG
jgi:hypothetical protein